MKICYFSKDAVQSIADGDEDMREYYIEMVERRYNLNDVILINDDHFNGVCEK